MDVIQELRSGTVSQGHIVSGDCVCDDYISRATVQTLDLLSQENPFYMFKSSLSVWILTGADPIYHDVVIVHYSFHE